MWLESRSGADTEGLDAYTHGGQEVPQYQLVTSDGRLRPDCPVVAVPAHPLTLVGLTHGGKFGLAAHQSVFELVHGTKQVLASLLLDRIGHPEALHSLPGGRKGSAGAGAGLMHRARSGHKGRP